MSRSALVFLEFPDEVDAYLTQECSSDHLATSAILIALNPPAQAHLQRLEYAALNTLPYFDNTSHADVLKKSEQLTRWIRDRVEFEDNWGIRSAYVERLVWHTRLVVHHCLWALDILQSAVRQHGAEKLCACLPRRLDFAGSMIGFTERYFGMLAQAFAAVRGLEFHPIVLNVRESQEKRTDAFIRRCKLFIGSTVVAPLAAPLHRSRIRRLGVRRPVLFTTKSYRMDTLGERSRLAQRGFVSVLLQTWGAARSLRSLVSDGTTLPFDAEVRLAILEPFIKENKDSHHRLDARLKKLVHDIRAAPDVFSHYGVSFAELVARKIQYGLSPFLLALHQRAAMLRWVLGTLRPALVVSAGDRADDMITGELCRLADIPAVLISHGSHVPPKSDLERIEWGEHGQPLLRAPFPNVALQSPLAAAFLDAFPSQSHAIRTGPLLWGSPVNRERSASSLRQMLGGHLPRHVIVYAGSYKARHSSRLYVFETSDEYVQSLRDLALAVESLRETYLVVQFRASPDLSVEDLKTLIPFPENVILSVDKPFLDVLGFADLLVSFSSTTIEEALQNDVPVLLYGGGGRYQHVPGAIPVTPAAPVPPAAAYFVAQAEDLTDALARILEVHARAGAQPHLFAPYRIPLEERVSLAAFVDATAHPKLSASQAG